MLDLRRFGDSSAKCDLEAGETPISDIVAGIPGIEPMTFCSASQELNH